MMKIVNFLLFIVMAGMALILPRPCQSQLGTIDGEMASKLLSIKRIYVEEFGDDKEAKILQSMVINALTQTKRFIVTENKGKADATLKGTALEKRSQELHSTASGTSVSSILGGFSADRRTAGGAIGGVGMGTGDASTSTETIDHAALSVRLVSADGDTIWSTTQESKGAKYKGAGADVADKIVKQLLQDLERAQKQP